MDLWCVPGKECLTDKMIILPNEVELESVELLKNYGSSQQKIQIQNKVMISEQNSGKPLDQVFDMTKVAQLVHQNTERVDEIKHCFIGIGDEKVNIGPIVCVVNRNTFAEISGNKISFEDRNPIGSNGKYTEKRTNKMGIKVAEDEATDQLILVVKDGCVVVKAGGILICEFPVVVVKSNGDYTTIGGPNNIMRLKSGTHLVVLLKLGIPVPLLFLRRQRIS